MPTVLRKDEKIRWEFKFKLTQTSLLGYPAPVGSPSTPRGASCTRRWRDLLERDQNRAPLLISLVPALRPQTSDMDPYCVPEVVTGN